MGTEPSPQKDARNATGPGGIDLAGPTWLGRVAAKTLCVPRYAAILGRNLGRRPSNEVERGLNSRLAGYPRNHNYRILDGRVVPSFRLFQRLRAVAALCPEPLESFLDVGCCRGMFVIDAARRGPQRCRVSVGIDVYEPFVAVANQVREYLHVEAAEFRLATLALVAQRPEAFGGPFQTVLLLGTYHYLFWGSQLSPIASFDHREILVRLAAVATDRVIFSARLEVERLPRPLREVAKSSGKSGDYSTSRCLEAAAEFFDVRRAGRIGKDPLLVMFKRGTQLAREAVR